MKARRGKVGGYGSGNGRYGSSGSGGLGMSSLFSGSISRAVILIVTIISLVGTGTLIYHLAGQARPAAQSFDPALFRSPLEQVVVDRLDQLKLTPGLSSGISEALGLIETNFQRVRDDPVLNSQTAAFDEILREIDQVDELVRAAAAKRSFRGNQGSDAAATNEVKLPVTASVASVAVGASSSSISNSAGGSVGNYFTPQQPARNDLGIANEQAVSQKFYDISGLNYNYEALELNLGLETVLLIVASNRPEYLDRTLKAVLKYHPRNVLPILISEDGNDPRVAEVVERARKEFRELAPSIPFVHKHHPHAHEPAENGYIRLSRHFKWALRQVFEEPIHPSLPFADRVIILEEDLEIAPDFFEYFASLTGLLDFDHNLLAVSAWNDNGQGKFVKDNKQLYRSDFFPGLGWMMIRRVWEELDPKWPKGYWDDWLREPAQRKGRHIIRPEVCRTYHFGAHGVSNNQYSQYLNEIKLNSQFVPFLKIDVVYLESARWDSYYTEKVYEAQLTSTDNFPGNFGASEVTILYSTLDGPEPDSFVNIARWAGVMDNIKAGVPRTAYKGIVTVWKDGIKLNIAPASLE